MRSRDYHPSSDMKRLLRLVDGTLHRGFLPATTHFSGRSALHLRNDDVGHGRLLRAFPMIVVADVAIAAIGVAQLLISGTGALARKFGTGKQSTLRR